MNGTNVTATAFRDASQALIPVGTVVSFQPCDPTTRQPLAYHAGGDTAGARSSAAVSVTVVTAGAFAITLDDTTLTNPVNIGYLVAAKDRSGRILLNGYVIQPHGASYNFDTDFVPNAGSLALLQVGPTGPQGLSAYQVYQAAGGQLSQGDWLTSLHGDISGVGAAALLANPNVNLIDPDQVIIQSLLASDSNQVVPENDSRMYVSNYFVVQSGGSIVCNHVIGNYGSAGYVFYDANKTPINGAAVALVPGTAISVPAGAVFARVSGYTGADGGDVLRNSLAVFAGATLPSGTVYPGLSRYTSSVLSQIRSAASAPSGSCAGAEGQWVFSQDGHATFADPVTHNWITKL